MQKSVEKEPVRVSRFYIDTNHHMNNGKYILVAEEYLPEQVFVCGLRAEYRKAAMLGDMLYPVVTMEEKQITVTLADEKGASYAIICFQKMCIRDRIYDKTADTFYQYDYWYGFYGKFKKMVRSKLQEKQK